LMKSQQSDWTICRLPGVYGPGDYARRFAYIGKRIKDGRTDWVVGKDYLNFKMTHAYVENVAQAIVLAAVSEGGRNRVFNIGELDTPTFRERYEKVINVFGYKLRIYEAKDSEMDWLKRKPRVNLEQNWVVSSRRIREELGYQESVGLEEGYRRTLQWEMDTPLDTVDCDYESEDRLIASGRCDLP
ncbi:MAG: NAD(P)-dependent oxidoreductase, partial [Symploca sp. SIO2D2]|nr:NAD(P)-dependent oxidoreductase [Symploca sp. SIO2D2]